MEKETYKNAKLILERFDPEAKKKAVSDLCLCFCPLLLLEESVYFMLTANVDFPGGVLKQCLFCVLRRQRPHPQEPLSDQVSFGGFVINAFVT